ncbi:NlpC/P60 family protein [Streptomyces sp. NPDC002599]|uniref:C40 family peptidase n=1 Tax=Streptomyces sp. NPDC002599 TaxID=3154421 RepID=UPI00331E167D
MDFTVAQAAIRLRISAQAVYDALKRGDLERVPGEGLILLTAESVDVYARQRRTRAAAGVDPLAAARYLAGRLRPPADPLTVDGRSVVTGEAPKPVVPPTREDLRTRRDRALTYMPALRAVFSADTLDAVILPDGAGCRWCASEVPAAEVFADHDGVGQAMYRALFASEPCARDLDRWDAQITEDEQRRAAAVTASAQAAADARMRADALRFAELKIGAPYADKADGPMSFNCAGLVRWAYAQAAGVLVPRMNLPLIASGQRVELDGLEPGDLVLNGPATHVGLYAGSGRVLQAADGGVQYTSLEGFTDGVRLSRAGLVASGQPVGERSLTALMAASWLRAVGAEMGLTLGAS